MRERLKNHEYIFSTDDMYAVDMRRFDELTELIRCKDCIHKPTITADDYENGFDIEFPDFRCPCRCEDGWYKWIPEDDWFCGNGERKEE